MFFTISTKKHRARSGVFVVYQITVGVKLIHLIVWRKWKDQWILWTMKWSKFLQFILI